MDQPNIILIVFDTLRKDVLPMYGGNANTPNLNEFIKDAVVFPNAISPTSWTLPSHVSLFTGDYLIEHEGKNFFANSPSAFKFKIKSAADYVIGDIKFSNLPASPFFYRSIICHSGAVT